MLQSFMRLAGMSWQRKIALSLAFVALGFIGAAVRYWRWWPSHNDLYFTLAGFACPLCPNIDGIGADWQKFLSRTLFGGILNFLPALILGWLATYAIQLKNARVATDKSPYH
jgi:hypothetical protein